MTWVWLNSQPRVLHRRHQFRWLFLDLLFTLCMIIAAVIVRECLLSITNLQWRTASILPLAVCDLHNVPNISDPATLYPTSMQTDPTIEPPPTAMVSNLARFPQWLTCELHKSSADKQKVFENRTSHQDQQPLITRLSYNRRHTFCPVTAAYPNDSQDYRSFTPPSDGISFVSRVPEITSPRIDDKGQWEKKTIVDKR